MIEQGLPVGNGRLGALASNDPGRELLLVTDATLWTGGLNDTLDSDGQFPYRRSDFGSLTLLAKLTVDIPDHDLSAVNGYRRTLDLGQGVVGTSYDIKAHTGVTAQALIDGYRQIIERAHAAGKCVVGATVGPFKGWSEWDEAGEAVRQEVDEFIRTSGEFDAVTDFDRILRSPYDHERMLPVFDGGDHIHPQRQGHAGDGGRRRPEQPGVHEPVTNRHSKAIRPSR